MAAGAGLALTAGYKPPSLFASSEHRPRHPIRPPGSRPDPRKPEGTDLLPKVEHIVIYMQENHSYDNYFGLLGRGDGFTYVDGAPTNSNVDADGQHRHRVPRADHLRYPSGASQSWNDSHISWNSGAMDGFAKASGNNVMGYYDEHDIPFYYGLAHVPRLRPVVLFRPRADVPEPPLPAGGHVRRPHHHRPDRRDRQPQRPTG